MSRSARGREQEGGRGFNQPKKKKRGAQMQNERFKGRHPGMARAGQSGGRENRGKRTKERKRGSRPRGAGPRDRNRKNKQAAAGKERVGTTQINETPPIGRLFFVRGKREPKKEIREKGQSEEKETKTAFQATEQLVTTQTLMSSINPRDHTHTQRHNTHSHTTTRMARACVMCAEGGWRFS